MSEQGRSSLEANALSLEIDEPGPPLIHEQGETEDELSTHNPIEFEAALSSTDWTVETLVNQMRKGRINLNPDFQRRNAWLDQRKSQLIESIILRYPVPQLVLAEDPAHEGVYIVIDGKQRLLALRQFCVDKDDKRDREFSPLKLQGLKILTDLNGLYWPDIQNMYPAMAARLENQTVRTVFISKWRSQDLLLSLFLRLNTGSVTLSPQELRQALRPGPFVEWVDLSSGRSQELRNLLGSTQPDRRMVDAELLLRYLALRFSTHPYKGNLKKFLDDTCASFNKDWPKSRTRIETGLVDLESAISAGREIFGSHLCRKWTRDRYERPFNRALFDIQMVSLTEQVVREEMLRNAEDVVEGFKLRCDHDSNFVRSITTTTKSVEAFLTRFEAWRDIVREATGRTFRIPASLDAGRIF
ncbi:DUF262 domain-containing protein [Nonomuraea phyllanthi]|uniref:DUF262 domain-containing protein n=1 Tax=Nonomuraea phyllanthi TaxID=2219224 RepID=A0A5C4WAP2_9ACTN|nr:DUF262 domain-containing protein [Nonomuraea phyllanthi]KAB8192574.1 DUF262 domain-containing protein [Nonomuraea phyllanthi]QFY08051.1 DUF262 domain-containing protein [Nonomuraea phyllanthi]